MRALRSYRVQLLAWVCNPIRRSAYWVGLNGSIGAGVSVDLGAVVEISEGEGVGAGPKLITIAIPVSHGLINEPATGSW